MDILTHSIGFEFVVVILFYFLFNELLILFYSCPSGFLCLLSVVTTFPLSPLVFVLRYCHLSAGEAAVSVHRARQSQSAGHRGSTRQCHQSARVGAEVSRQG